jgi:hypothetical protein
MAELSVRERFGEVIRRTVHSGAVHAGFAVLALGFAAMMLFDATSAVGMAPIEGRSLTAMRPLWIPLVLVWTSALLGLLALWLRRTDVPETSGDGWTAVGRVLWTEWVTQGLRWIAVLGIVQVGFVLSVTWTKWLGLVFGYESAVTGAGSEVVLFAPFAVGGVVVAAYSLLAFYRGRASA